MSPDQIGAYLTASPRKMVMEDGKSYKITYGASGSADLQVIGSNFKTSGKWRLSADGYCTTYGSQPENCYTMEKDGDKARVFQDNKRIGVCLKFE